MSGIIKISFNVFLDFMQQFAMAFFWSNWRNLGQRAMMPSQCFIKLI